MNVSKSPARATLALAAFILLAAAPCLAQEARATISGTITDPSGSALVGARVHITNLETGIVLSAVSNEVGQGTISAAGRKRIAAAQRARWAKVRAGKKKAA